MSERFADWFESPLGSALLEQERAHCRALVPSGYYPSALQAGRASLDFLDGIETGSRFFIGRNAPRARDDDDSDARAERPTHRAIAKSSAMPFADKTHNLIVLPHTLDFCDDPHAVLREVTQILIPQGCVVITGFNQMSLWGAARVMMKASGRAPWSGRYHRVGRVQDWLALLGFELVGAAMLGYQPPLQNERWRRKLAFIDAAGARWWPGLGAAYVIVGRKQEAAITRRAAQLRWRRFIRGIAPSAQPMAHRISDRGGDGLSDRVGDGVGASHARRSRA
ncbi:MAG: class I SAM-dependent methyltransferase [bacterium]